MDEPWADPAIELPKPGAFVEFISVNVDLVTRGIFDRRMFCGRWHDTPPERVLRWRLIPADRVHELES